jgi:wyosine [tRNA(Phe)-imidazoG37] synthetase (radical SAM superfamily)
MINRRLFDHYGIDTTKDLNIARRCPRPFDTVLIDKQGSCYACECQSWLPQSIGNLQIRSLEEIIGGDMHEHLRKAIEDGTYRYCNENQCSYIRANEVYEPNFQHTPPAHVRHLRLAIDDSCNLRCPSCRTGMVFHKEGAAYNKGIVLADRINEWLQQYTHPVQVHIGSDGDPFASHIYRHFMANTPDRRNITYSILTNGLMFKDFHDRVPHVINGLEKLAVSIDGASQDTYEKLRLGGKWDKLMENIQSMSSAKAKHGFGLEWHMVVQKDNWREMPDLLRMARTHSVDRVYFNRIQDWNTGLDFSQQAIQDHPEFRRLVSEIESDPISVVSGLA